jgi:CheY-like chemotaxis protein
VTEPQGRTPAKEIALGLARALERAFEIGAPASAFGAAREAAQIVAMPGLERLLGALAPHAGRPWPRELEPVTSRLLRIAADATRAGDLAPFHLADGDLSALAGEVEGIEWSRRPGGDDESAVPTLDAAEVLAELPLEGAPPSGVRLTAPVAAALRAALDWLVGEGGSRRPLRVTAGESVLEVTCESVHPGGLAPAHDVLSEVGGSLGAPPAGGETPPPPGTCRLRVPTFSSRTLYLMIRQGGVPLAVPWHAVLRVHVVPAAELESREGTIGGVVVLPPVAPSGPVMGERPVALLGHGFKRGYLVADRLVWRLPGEPVEAPGAPPAPGLSLAVRSEEGEVYWLADPARLLAAVPLPPLPRPRRAKSAPVARSPEPPPLAEPPIARPPIAEPPAASPAPRPAFAAPRAPSPTLRLLQASDVEALPLEVAREAPPSPPSGPQTPASVTVERVAPRPARPLFTRPPSPSREAPAASRERPAEPGAVPAAPRRRALVAEDSFTARLFLARMLDQRGFDVTVVPRARELMAEIERGPWALLCVDADLPDASGAEVLRTVTSRASAPLVALVRDRLDIELAASAGVSRVLRKPFDTDELDALMARLFPARDAR